jgi:hypothetical protein
MRSGATSESRRTPALTVDRRLYNAAVSHGIDVTGRTADTEDAERPVQLLATATVHTPALLVTLAAGSRRARTISAGLVRLAHHALAVHARDNDYDPEPWILQAVTLAGLLTLDQQEDGADPVGCQQDAVEHLSDAIVALGSDRMGFPDHLTQAQGAWLAWFAVARGRR